MLCTLDDLKQRLGIETKSEHDALLTRLIAGFTRRADSYTHRGLIVTAAAVTEYYAGGTAYLQLRRYPIVAITSIKECLGYNFTEAEPLTAGEEYRIVQPGEGDRGVLERLWCPWRGGLGDVQVVYRGGFCAAGATPAAGEFALPDDLREAAIQQCSLLFKRRDDIGLSGVSFDGGGFNKLDRKSVV